MKRYCRYTFLLLAFGLFLSGCAAYPVVQVAGGAMTGYDYLLDNFATFRKPARYMTESNEIAKLVRTIPPRFNRLIFYSGRIPHNAAISAPDLLSNDARTGRLTLNIFADVLPK